MQIYGASGCPKYRLAEANGNLRKRTRAEGDFVAKDGPSYMNDNELGSNGPMGSGTFIISQHQTASTSNTLDFDSDIGRLPIVSKTRQYEEPLCMIERDDGCIQGEYRRSLYDLSKYEIYVGAQKSSDCGRTMPEFPIEADMLNNDPVNLSGDVLGTCVEKPAEKGKNCVAMPEEDAICLKSEKPSTTHPIGGEGSSHQENTIRKSPAEADMFDKDPVKLSRHVLETFAAKTAESGKKTLQVPKRATLQNADERSKRHPRNGEKGIKEGSHTFSLPTKDDVIYEVVKEEPIDFNDMPLPDDANASCLVVVGSEHYLELPTNFTSLVSRRSRADRKVVFLRGPDTRLWAVLYIQKFGIKILNSRWQVFCKANGVQPRDECLFQRESNDSECIFRVSVVNRQVGGT